MDSRPGADSATIRRRRECENCGMRWTTYEKSEEIPVMVIKKNGERQIFERKKLIAGLMRALEKRSVSADKIEDIVRRIEVSVSNVSEKEVDSRIIGELVLEQLKTTDEVAFIRYASVYRKFDDVNAFIKEIKNLSGGRKKPGEGVAPQNEKVEIYQIAVDGPSGSGKSTVSRKIANELNIDYLDTGAMYRALAYKISKSKTDYENEAALKEILAETEIDFRGGEVYLDGKKLGDEIRTPKITKLASDISALPKVRKRLVSLQRNIGKKKSVIADGRDIGTNVFTGAKYKFFLNATPEIRARRRFDEMVAKGQRANYDTVLEDIKIRDFNDANRKTNPLKKADDAIEIDTSDLSESEVRYRVISLMGKADG
jgi:cytidylate kinase